MKSKEIRGLLEKYFEGTSSQEEEAKIRSFFRNSTYIPQNLQKEKAIFDYFEREKQVTADVGITSVTGGPTAFSSKKRNLIYLFSGIAATLLLLAGLFLFQSPKPSEEKVYVVVNGEPVRNRELAIEQTKEALSMVSENFQKGTKELEYLAKFHETQQFVTKNE